jgi:RNA polymerase sigma factor (sigma-70 family)
MAVRTLRLPTLLARPPAGDADLLTRFVESADHEAFAELVRRHAGMVRGVCRRALGDTPDADDAFQATFLVFVRKARSVSPRSQVGNFLYGVAHRTAAHARAARTRRSARLRNLPDMPAVHPDVVDADQLAALDDELAKLPDVYRAAVVLCELEGLSLKEAAGRTKVPVGTLASRLARGRRLLAERLTGRGLAGVLLALGGAASAAVPHTLLTRVLTGAGETAPASELAHRVLKAMLVTKLQTLGKAAVGVLVVVGLLAGIPVGTAAPEPRPAARAKAPVPEGTKAADKELEALFDDLGDKDADKAVKAAVWFAGRPKEGVAFLRKRIKAVELDEKALDGWVADLTGGDAEKQKAAAKALEPVSSHPPVARRLLTAAQGTTDQEVRRRLMVVLFSSWNESKAYQFEVGPTTEIVFTQRKGPDDQGMTTTGRGGLGGGRAPETIDLPANPTGPIVGPSKGSRRLTRAVTILEQVGTPDAVAVLKELAGGHPEAEPTAAAKAALERLK